MEFNTDGKTIEELVNHIHSQQMMHASKASSRKPAGVATVEKYRKDMLRRLEMAEKQCDKYADGKARTAKLWDSLRETFQQQYEEYVSKYQAYLQFANDESAAEEEAAEAEPEAAVPESPEPAPLPISKEATKKLATAPATKKKKKAAEKAVEGGEEAVPAAAPKKEKKTKHVDDGAAAAAPAPKKAKLTIQ